MPRGLAITLLGLTVAFSSWFFFSSPEIPLGLAKILISVWTGLAVAVASVGTVLAIGYLLGEAFDKK